MAKGLFVVGIAAACLAGPPSLCLGEDQPSLRAYGMRLAHNAVPAGIVAAHEALIFADVRPAVAKRRAEEPGFNDDLESNLSRFNAAQGQFRAVRTEGVVHIRGAEEPSEVATALEGRTSEDATDTMAMQAVLHQVTRAMGGMPVGGIIGVGPLPEPGCPVDKPVRIPAGTTAIDALDQIVRQVPGLVWVVSYSPGSAGSGLTLKVGLMCADGYVGTVTVNR
jgi:hypothetical protein